MDNHAFRIWHGGKERARGYLSEEGFMAGINDNRWGGSKNIGKTSKLFFRLSLARVLCGSARRWRGEACGELPKWHFMAYKWRVKMKLNYIQTLNPYNQSKTKLIGIMQCLMNSLYMRMIWDNDIEYIGNDMGELMMMQKHSHFPPYWYTSPKHNVNIIRAA